MKEFKLGRVEDEVTVAELFIAGGGRMDDFVGGPSSRIHQGGIVVTNIVYDNESSDIPTYTYLPLYMPGSYYNNDEIRWKGLEIDKYGFQF